MNDERLQVLEMIESGRISVEEGVRLLESLSEDDAPAAPIDAEAPPPDGQTQATPDFPIPAFVRVAWQIVFGVGIAVLGAGGFLLARAYGQDGRAGLGWGWALFALGLLMLLLGWWLQRARWFYLRIRERGGIPMTIALPLPLGLVVALLRIAKPVVPQLQEMEADQLILAMQDELRAGHSFAVHVDEGEGGDQVEIYFC